MDSAFERPVSVSAVVEGGTIAKGGPDDEQCYYSVRCDDVSVSGQRRMDLREGPNSVPCSVKGHRTRPVMI